MLAMVAMLAIMIILLAVLALVVVNALRDSPWGVFTIALHHPDRDAHGLLDAGVAARANARGVGDRLVLLLLALVGGRWVAAVAHAGARSSRCSAPTLACGIIAYGFVASVLPVWLLLAPRDYLSTFMKIGTIARCSRSASCSCCRRSRCRRSRSSSTAPGRCSPASSSRSRSSPSPAARSAGSTR